MSNVQDVIKSVCHKMSSTGANLGGSYPSALNTIQDMARARDTVAQFFNCAPAEVVFGANMTSLTSHVSRSVGRDLSRSDNVVVTMLDHDANVTPWTRVAEDAGAQVRVIPFTTDQCTLDMSALRDNVDTNTALVALGAAANSCGSITDIKTAVRMVKEASGGRALVYVDAVHFAPHRLIDVQELGCDFLVCSSYKFCGPHSGAMYGRSSVLESLTPYKLRACTDLLPAPASSQSSKWETGENHFLELAMHCAGNYSRLKLKFLHMPTMQDFF